MIGPWISKISKKPALVQPKREPRADLGTTRPVSHTVGVLLVVVLLLVPLEAAAHGPGQPADGPWHSLSRRPCEKLLGPLIPSATAPLSVDIADGATERNRPHVAGERRKQTFVTFITYPHPCLAHSGESGSSFGESLLLAVYVTESDREPVTESTKRAPSKDGHTRISGSRGPIWTGVWLVGDRWAWWGCCCTRARRYVAARPRSASIRDHHHHPLPPTATRYKFGRPHLGLSWADLDGSLAGG